MVDVQVNRERYSSSIPSSASDQPKPWATRASWVGFSCKVAMMPGSPRRAADDKVQAHEGLAGARGAGDQGGRPRPVAVGEHRVQGWDARRDPLGGQR